MEQIRSRYRKAITLHQLVRLAAALRSEDGLNTEYDRALVELCVDAAGLSQEVDRAAMVAAIEEEARVLGVQPANRPPAAAVVPADEPLDALERLLTLTEPLLPQLEPDAAVEWREISAGAADTRLRLDAASLAEPEV
jgi:hypothetical protein